MRPTLACIALTLFTIPAPGAAQAAGSAQHPAETHRIRLEADTVADGIHCAATGESYAEFFVESGRLAECPLAGDAAVGGYALPSGSWVVLHPDGRLRLAWLSRDTRIGAVTCKGTGYKEWVTEFDDDGGLQRCFLPTTTTIQGIPCRAGSFFGEITGGVAVRFHPNGRLASCALARPTTIGGERYRTWRRVELDPDGHINE